MVFLNIAGLLKHKHLEKGIIYVVGTQNLSEILMFFTL